MDVDTIQAAGRSSVGEERRAVSVPLEPSRQPQYTVGYVYDPVMMSHWRPGLDHPEQPERISRIYQIIKDNKLLNKMKRIPIRRVRHEEVLLVHSAVHLAKVLEISSFTEEYILESDAFYNELSLYVSPKTPLAAELSAGGVIEATLAVARNELKKTFAIVRPPGHHAEPEEHMGFCFFNNVAIAVRTVQQMTNIRKILILDWDVHHGNGTQKAFYDDPSVLYMSLHRYEGGRFYPCGPFGSMEMSGEGDGVGYSVNIPWPEKGMRDADYLHAFYHVVMPIAREFAPELVIISAGFDAADGDELGECHVSPAGYAHMTHMLSSLAGGRLVVALEGGYNLDAISNSALAVARMIVGEEPPELAPMVASETGTETVYQVAKEQSKYWKSVVPKAVEPREELEPLTFSIPELLKAHRQDYMYRHHNMLQIPLLTQNTEERFGTQIMCTPDINDNKTMVIFLHEFGNIQVEFDSIVKGTLHEEHSYLVDCSRQVVDWVREEGYSLLDVNIHAKPVEGTEKKRGAQAPAEQELITYLWDNYVLLSKAKCLILIGHGSACQTLMLLMNTRPNSMMRRTLAILQIVGNGRVPLTPKDSKEAVELKAWYAKHSLVIIPKNHRLLSEKPLKRHGRLWVIEETKPVKLMMKALPAIQKYVRQAMAALPRDDALVNGDS
ncbi:histone deacetylase complex protein [Gloeophyllum trabeum ATCC 11539]|uniref:histone deacetylase n=1 Tax=Gloeophyllum trabeum (strain ATCC 11539 / FP-39264 / Madison 617) TaxID=670483 RepID=S7RVT7_GLOTA|nr:histone deacetylase complex protein [Gloeophyllum trabeum ATCC 11539]EPQ57394.1 histone deacetylase complex protein [Gloeophyllum trabeum ATCC 11539]